MYNLIVKSKKIVETEIYNNRIIYFLTNISVLLLIVMMQFGDITNQVSGNYFVIFWIAINVSLTFNIFLRNNREHILCIGKLGNEKRYLFLLLYNVMTNLPWMLILVLQLVIIFKANFLNALVIAFTQFVYAISLGAICGTFKNKIIGCMLIIIYWIYSFVFCNPLFYEASSHVTFVSEPVFTVNNLNMESITNLFICSVFFLLLTYLKVKMDIRKNVKTVIAIVGFVIVYSVFLHNSLCRYYKEDGAEYKTYASNPKYEYKGLSDAQIGDVINIVDMMVSDFSIALDGQNSYDKIYINKHFLPEILWLTRKEDIRPLEIKDNIININVMAPNMVYFENSDLLKNFMEIVSEEMNRNIPNYNTSKFSRHIIDGYAMGILEDMSEKLSIDSAKEVHDSLSEENSEMLSNPATKYIYTKKIAYIVYTDYPEYTSKLYSDVCEKGISSDTEFIDLLKNGFNEIYNDKKVADILAYSLDA